ncbi:MAG TPA: hypothetical protein PKA63_14085 [Oligoflexia bacterium]|nr:hypothetical protein [Oligoflexia bacterium]HMP49793.1 hypothetical protein [Oligoflexia bacterium]
MSNLDAYHPFRASVNTAKSSLTTDSKSDSASDSSTSWRDEKEEKLPRFSWKTKFRIYLAGLSMAFILYIIYQINSYFGSESAKVEDGPSMLDEMQLGRAEMNDVFTRPQHFDKNDLNDRGRTVEESRKKAGFWKGLLCRGGKSSSFCQ